MNKVILMGRLTRDPEVRYTQSATPMAVTRYALAVRRTYVREGEPEADFFNIVAFGKPGEFAEKYFKKGQMVAISGRLQQRSWDDPQKGKQYMTEVIVEDQYFAESKATFEANRTNDPYISPSNDIGITPKNNNIGIGPVMDEEEDLPF
ncbi:single-stranded DNA-binding protein [Candidatus Epulonipiscium fishelsonii]|uniref:Single-stranded DNA-binding protein n=1 Tax=Candidatus Epulonipiscium fishelsonii TaxID=77094 RepID=A0ACC8XCK3_9FIRM|nr:single-stranded DNA-binding protein [Epulopiscium sp. SCG-B11WGA-EpuloA1]ONI43199.1 single-stranded DNA-binding protein [Epulopiscium sp. SCG-B05WGA-EpuloA1]